MFMKKSIDAQNIYIENYKTLDKDITSPNK